MLPLVEFFLTHHVNAYFLIDHVHALAALQSIGLDYEDPNIKTIFRTTFFVCVGIYAVRTRVCSRSQRV